MATFGVFSLLVALLLAAWNLVVGGFALLAIERRWRLFVPAERLADTARRAGIGSFYAVSGAVFALVWLTFNNDFTIYYILQHSNRALDPWYKFAALWSGQEGSLLFWAWLLALYGLVLRLTHKADVKLHAYAGVILAGVQVFFLYLVNWVAKPFALTPGLQPGDVIQDGNGLNPLLQYAEMVIHPPMLYLGYVGFTIPFAFALGALMMRYPGEKWIQITRRWTLVTWLFLTVGVFLGMHWAYAVLGWGGYWGWDPVENASLMPWLAGTAFFHSVIIQEKRGMLKIWNVWLIFITFLLSIIGTLLTRGGLVSSVHAFAQSDIGYWFTGFLVFTLAVCIFTFILQHDHLKSENHFESMVSRETSFLFNNLLLLAASFTILLGTLFPVLREYVVGDKVTVGAPYYNRVELPIGLLLLFLTGVGPLLAWRSTSLKSIRRNFILPLITFWITAIVLIFVGMRPYKDLGEFFAWLCFSLCVAVTTAILSEFLRGAQVIHRQTGKNIFVSTLRLLGLNTRRYGGYVVHLGVVVILIGLAGAVFNRSNEQEMAVHDQLVIGPYTLECTGFTQDSNDNYDSDYAVLEVSKGGVKQFDMTPEKRIYRVNGQPQTMVAIHSTPMWDLYVVFEGENPDTGQPIIKAFLNPLVVWVWIGLGVTVFGTILALIPSEFVTKVLALFDGKPATRSSEV
jgi:cytochrome c-type biogenesis protein CcmF